MKKVFTVVTLIFALLISGCSCDKFDIDTYGSAVKNLKNSTGFEYKLTVTIKTEGQGYYRILPILRFETRRKRRILYRACNMGNRKRLLQQFQTFLHLVLSGQFY